MTKKSVEKKKKYNISMAIRLVDADIGHVRQPDGFFHWKVTDKPVYAKHIEITNKNGEEIALFRLRNVGIAFGIATLAVAKLLL